MGMGMDRGSNREWTQMDANGSLRGGTVARVRGAEGINQPQVKKDVLMGD